MKIKSRYRKPISEQRFNSMKAMLGDEQDKELFNQSFAIDEKRKYRLNDNLDDKGKRDLIRLLKGIRKARSGPRTIRLILLALVIIVPVAFNLLFLNTLLAKGLENLLERVSGTDVSVQALEISPFKGRASLEKLAFASVDEPMVDAWVAEQLLFDADMMALLRRRLVLHSIKGRLSRNVPRSSPAVYPEKPEKVDKSGESVSAERVPIKLPDFSIDPSAILGEMNFDSISLAENLRSEEGARLEQRYQDIRNRLESDIVESQTLLNDVQKFISSPVPGKKDVQQWMSYIDEGRTLGESLDSQGRKLREYQKTLEELSNEATALGLKIQNAVESDIVKIKDSLKLDGNTLNNLVQKALFHYAGKRVVQIYERAMPIARQALLLKSEKSKKSGISKAGKTKREGRRVAFPVRLPPRFSIRELSLAGEGVEISGTNVGVDHRLAGAASILNLGIDERISAAIIVDTRKSADSVVASTLNFDGYPWRLSGGELDGLNGLMSISGLLNVSEINADAFSASLNAELALNSWAADETSGFVALLAESAPAMDLSLGGDITQDTANLSVGLAAGSIGDWSSRVLNALLPGGTQALQQELKSLVGEESQYLSSLELLFNQDKQSVSRLLTDRNELNKKLEAKLKELSGDVLEDPGNLDPESLIGGLKSLF